MPLLILLALGAAAGVCVYLAASLYPWVGSAPASPTRAAERQLKKEVIRRPWLARLLRSRLDPGTATGLALTVALTFAVAGGMLLGALAYLVRSNARLVELDASVGQWAADHATHWSTQIITLVTDMAATPTAIVVIVVVTVVETVRVPNRWIAPFVITAVLGEVIIVNTVKQLLDRVRPTFNPIAETLGPSFPSGHSATAAALYAAVALVLARRRSPRIRALLAGAAAGIAVAVAASRVMLGVHWLSDVIAGLAFGWAWFAVCAIAFGGRFLSFAAPVKEATRVAERVEDPVQDVKLSP